MSTAHELFIFHPQSFAGRFYVRLIFGTRRIIIDIIISFNIISVAIIGIPIFIFIIIFYVRTWVRTWWIFADLRN